MKKKIVVGMSGGVDSSVAAYILKEQGYEVIGLFMRNWHETDNEGHCTAEQDFCDVRSVCALLDIPYYTVDFASEYAERVFAHFVDEYKKGRTPNPDVLCNKEIKFDIFTNFAKTLGASYVATGHYAKIENKKGLNYLVQAKDKDKDQTYFLNQLSAEQLDGILFPIGNLTKSEVRKIAVQQGIPTANKKDSTGICFIGERKFRKFLGEYIPMKKGDIVTLDGQKVGEHLGVFYYTIGQRKGLGVGGGGSGEPYFVINKDIEKNILYVSQGECKELFASIVEIDKFNYIPSALADGIYDVKCRIRHRQPLQAAKAKVRGQKVKLDFDIPQRAVAEGQYAVLYMDRYCIGGGAIERKLQ